MIGIFKLYFRRNLPWAGAGLAVCLLSIPLLGRFELFQDPDILLIFWVSIMLPAASLLLGATAGAEAASEAATGAETVLPISGFARLAGAALSAVAITALISAVLLAVSGMVKGGEAYVQGGFNKPTAAYLLGMLQACVFAFVFGRLSGSVIAGIVAGAGLTFLTASGILSSIAVDALILNAGGAAPLKIALLGLSALAGLLSLKYIAGLYERKARPGVRNVGAAALLLSAGLLAAGALLAASKGRAERILVPAHKGDPAFARFIVHESAQAAGYSLYLNPVKEELLLLGPDGQTKKLLEGRSKSYAEFFKEPMRYIVRASLAGENGEAWALLRDKGMVLKLYYAAPGEQLKPAAELGLNVSGTAAMVRIGGKAYIGMRGKPDTMHYLAELVPGAKALKWELIGTDSAEARLAVIKMQEASGEVAWLSPDGLKLLRSGGGRAGEFCRLPYKGAAFYHSPVYKAVRNGGRERFFVPLRKNGKPTLYFCEKGRAPALAWDGPENLMFKFTQNSDGSAFTSISKRDMGEDVDRVFYVLNEAGEFLPKIDANRAFAGQKFTTAYPVKSSGSETWWVLDDGRLVKLGSGGKTETVAAWETPVTTWRAVRDGIVYMNKSGMFLVSWKGEKNRLY